MAARTCAPSQVEAGHLTWGTMGFITSFNRKSVEKGGQEQNILNIRIFI